MKIGIIGAMDEEVIILKAKLKNIKTTIIAGCEFYQGELKAIEYFTMHFSLFNDTSHPESQELIFNKAKK